MINVSMFLLSDSRLRVTIDRGPQLTISQDDSLTITCTLACTCQGARVSWTRDDGVALPIQPTVEERPAVTGRLSRLSITRATNNVAGSYTCTGTLSGEDPERATIRITVTSLMICVIVVSL